MIHKFVLRNGLRVVFEPIEHVKSVTTGIWIGAGSIYETLENNGISHLIEHMLFKGTKNRDAFKIAEEIDSMGGHINAFTTKECTCYYTKVAAYHFEKSLEILSDMLFHSLMDEKELEKEKQVIFEEILMYEDSPEDCVHELLTTLAFDGNPIAYPILGDLKSVSSITAQTLREYMAQYYTASNTVISIVGNVALEEIEILCNQYFSQFFDCKESTINIPSIIYSTGKKGIHKEIEQMHLCIGTNGFERNSPYYHASNIFNNVVGGSMSSRLFQNIREKTGLVYSIYSFHSSYKYAGLFGIYTALKEENMERVLEELRKELALITQQGITKEEFERSKSQIQGNYVLSLESTSNRMTVLGRRELFYNETIEPEEIIPKIAAVQYDDVMDVCKALLDTKEHCIAFTGNIAHDESISQKIRL